MQSMDTSGLPKWARKRLDPIIAEIRRTRLLCGDGISLDETTTGTFVSALRVEEIIPQQPAPQKSTGQFWITVPLTVILEGQMGTETAGTPQPDFHNPYAYYPFAVPSGSYDIVFLDNVFQQIAAPSPGSISVSEGSVSNVTVTSVPDPFNVIPNSRIYSFGWELTKELSPLSSIPNNVQDGRFYFTNGIPSGAVYAVIGQPGNNIFGQRAINLGQFTIHSTADLGTFGSTI